MSKKIISFSLWGDNKLYCEGAIQNIYVAKEIYPDWCCRFYVASDCPALSKLKTLDCDVIEMAPQQGIDRTKPDWQWQLEHCGMFWRYFVIDELKKGDCAIFRDCDSRVSKREASVVNHWLNTNMFAHRIHENQSHWNAWAMGGMWGIKGGLFTGIKESIEQWIEIYKDWNHPYIFIDLEWLNSVAGPLLDHCSIGYGYGHENAIPALTDGEFPVGWVINEEWRNEKYE